MAFNLGELVFKMSADVASLRADMDEAKRTVGVAAQGIEAAMNVAKAAVISLGAAMTVSQFADWIKGSIDAADATRKQAQAAGVAVESLSALQYAASLSDVSNEELAASLAKLSKATREAATGHGAQAEAFQKLGVSATDSSGRIRNADAVMTDIAAKFAQMQDGAEKTTLAQDLFGKSGARLIPLLNSGADGLKQMADEAQRLGVVLSTEAAKQTEEFNDNLTRLQTASKGFAQSIAGDMLPGLNRITQAMITAREEGGTLYALWIAMGGIAAEALGLNDDSMQNVNKAIRETTKAIQLYEDEKQNASEQGFNTEGDQRAIDSLNMKLQELLRMKRQLSEPVSTSTAPVMEAPDLSGFISQQDTVIANIGKILSESERATAAQEKQLESLTAWVEQFSIATAAAFSDQFDASQQKQADQIQRVKDGLQTQQEAIEQAYQKKRETLLNSDFMIEEERTELLNRAQTERDSKTAAANEAQALKSKRDEEKNMTVQEKMWKSGLEGRLKVAGSVFGSLGQLMHSHNKTAFEIGKKASMAQAVIATYTSAVEAYKAMAGIPYVGPALGVAAAAAAIAAGMANVQAIQSQQFEGGGGGAAATYSAGPGGFPTSYPGQIQSDGPASLAQAQNNPSGPSITIYGDFYGDGEKVASDIKKLISDSDFVLVESTSRQASELRA